MPLGLYRQSLHGALITSITWSTSAGSLGTISDQSRNTDDGIITEPVVATSSSSSSVTYAITSGSISTGLTFNSNGTITGIATSVASNTTSTFTVRATNTEGAIADREFNITVNSFSVSTAINFDPTDTDLPGYGFPDPILLSDASYVRTTNSIATTASTVTEFTCAFWVKPSSYPASGGVIWNNGPGYNDNQFFCTIGSSGSMHMATDHQSGVGSTTTGMEVVFGGGHINDGSWNSVVISLSADNTVVSFGAGGDSGGGGTAKNHKFHVAINNTVYITGVSSVDGYYWARTGSGSNASDTINSLFNTASTDDTIIGCHVGAVITQAVQYFKGDLAHIWMKDVFYDLQVTENLRLFVNGSNKPVDYPSSPTTFLTGNATGFASSGSISEGTITRNNITNASSTP